MADERDEREKSEDEPKIRIVDRRMLSEEERAGRGAVSEAAEDESGARPKLEIIGGGAPSSTSSKGEAPKEEKSKKAKARSSAAAGKSDVASSLDAEDEQPLSDEEAAQLRAELEQQQFAAIEEQMGRPLTEREKDEVRAEMERQARIAVSLEVTPLLVHLMNEVSARAAVHMGLMPNPYTRIVARNDAQARLAIDAYAAVFEVLKPHLDAAAQRECARVLNDLRVNFVSSIGPLPGGPSGGAPSGPKRIIH